MLKVTGKLRENGEVKHFAFFTDSKATTKERLRKPAKTDNQQIRVLVKPLIQDCEAAEKVSQNND